MATIKVSGIIFDLDGTLIDSQYDLAAGVNEVRRAYGEHPLDLAAIRSYVGNGVTTLMERALPAVKGGELTRAVRLFRDYYSIHHLDSTVAFPGIKELLEGVSGKICAVLTNKPEKNAKAILEGLGLIEYFSLIWGGDSTKKKKPHPDPVLDMLKTLCLAPGDAVIVGDGVNDILAAKAAGIRSIAVGYGYTLKEALLALSPDYFAPAVSDLYKLFVS